MIIRFWHWLISLFASDVPAEFIPAVDEEAVKPLSARELQERWRPRIRWCADNVGRPFHKPIKAAAPGYFWKRDAGAVDRNKTRPLPWRIYHLKAV